MADLQRVYDEDLSIEDLLAVKLECPSCQLEKPLYRCNNGHILCRDCKTKETKCKECQKEVVELDCATDETSSCSATKEVSKLHHLRISYDYVNNFYLTYIIHVCLIFFNLHEDANSRK